jgi:hypothetical protein
MKYILLLILTLKINFLFAQNPSKWTFSAYGELYYSYDFAKPPNHEKSYFIYNHKRHNEVNVNLLIAKASFTDQNLRSNFALMAGTYSQYNLSAEPTWGQFIYEANVGIRLSKKQNLWLDAGILPSHIGFESAIGVDCWTLTRSLMAENSPYFETGLKLNYSSKDEKLNAALFFLNGWQRIRRVEGNQKPSIGMQLNYKPNAKNTLNYSNFIGSDKPDEANALRIFHNFYWQFEPNQNIGIIAGFDLGSENSSVWYSPNLILRLKTGKKSKVALRTEYYKDADQVIVTTNTKNGFDVLGISANYDYQFHPKALFRIETKSFQSKDEIFYNHSNKNFSITSALCIKL